MTYHVTRHQLNSSSFRLTERHMACIAHGAVSALKYLHALGVVHRDVKSDSILLSLTGQVYPFFESISYSQTSINRASRGR